MYSICIFNISSNKYDFCQVLHIGDTEQNTNCSKKSRIILIQPPWNVNVLFMRIIHHKLWFITGPDRFHSHFLPVSNLHSQKNFDCGIFRNTLLEFIRMWILDHHQSLGNYTWIIIKLYVIIELYVIIKLYVVIKFKNYEISLVFQKY